MERHEQLYKDYTNTLSQYIEQIKSSEVECKAKGDQASLVNAKVKGNVAEIFKKMFEISYNNTYVKRQIPDFAKYEETYSVKHERLKAAYLNFFTKIPGPWKEKAEKDKLFGRQAEFELEQIKLATAEEIKELFLGQFSRAYRE